MGRRKTNPMSEQINCMSDAACLLFTEERQTHKAELRMRYTFGSTTVVLSVVRAATTEVHSAFPFSRTPSFFLFHANAHSFCVHVFSLRPSRHAVTASSPSFFLRLGLLSSLCVQAVKPSVLALFDAFGYFTMTLLLAGDTLAEEHC